MKTDIAHFVFRHGKIVVLSCCVLLIISGSLKIWTALSGQSINFVIDPIIKLPNKLIFWGVGMLELVIGVAALIASLRQALLLLLWINGCFVLYRFCLYLSESQASCPCMGGVDRLLGWPKGTGDTVSKGMLVYMLFSCLLLLYHIRTQNHPAPNKFISIDANGRS